MTITHKKARLGRPRKGAADKQKDEKLASADGKRLDRARNELGWSQAELARRSGMRQGWINDIINGKRLFGREDLRRLGKAGIPPDYLLGLSDTLMPPGTTRPRVNIEGDLAAYLQIELKAKYPPEAMGNSEPHVWCVTGEGALRWAIEGALAAAKQELEIHRRLPKWSGESKAIHYAADLLQEDGSVNGADASRQLRQLAEARASEGEALLKAWTTAPSTRGIMLMPARLLYREDTAVK